MNEQSIFTAALEKAPAERRVFLDDACVDSPELRQRVERLIASHEAAIGFMDQPAGLLVETVDESLLVNPGTRIGPYKLLQQIGEGGMGVVYMAEQTEPVKRKVALKLIKPGMDSHQVIARFEAERQALAMMDHVNIARVLDAGTTSGEPGGVSPGRPYFVMELIHGVPITKYCDDNNLTPRQRLELFVPVCQAIQHAHQKGIIHRDIKPSNVMITLYDGKPVPKVIDFGVAKATEQKLTERSLFTQYGTMVGTLEYMSPEQAEMSALGVDTRSDIYSLGVLLYELLTGSTPLSHKRMKEVGYAEILRLIKEEEPPRPSTRLSESGGALASISAQRKTEPAQLSKLMRGELDWIVMKTLEKDRNRRYETANGFAADVQRYLNDEAVQACPPSAAYRFHKFARRNSVGILTGTAVCMALVLGTVISAWQAIRATRAQHEAEVARTEEATQRTVADRRRIEADEQRKEAESQRNEAESQRQQAEVARKEATANLQKAREAVDKMLTRVASDTLDDVPQMEPVRKALLEDALKFYQGFLQQKHANPALRLDTGRALERVGFIYHYFGQHDDAVNALRQSVTLLEELVVDFPAEPDYLAALAESCIWFGLELSWTLERYQEGEPVLRRAVALSEKLSDEFPLTPRHRERLVQARKNLAYALANLGRTRDAAEEYRSGLALAEKLADQFPTEPGYHELQAGILHLQGYLLANTDPPEAETAYRRALAFRVRALADSPHSHMSRFNVSWSQGDLADLLRKHGRLPEAEDAYRQAIAHCQPVVADFPYRLNYRSALCHYYAELGWVLEDTNRSDDAEQAYRLAWAAATDKVAPGADPPLFWFSRLDESQTRLVNLLTRAGRTPEVEAHYRQALVLWQKLAEQSPAVLEFRHKQAETHQLLAGVLLADNRPEEAEQATAQGITLLEETLALTKTRLGSEHPDTVKCLSNLANAYKHTGRFADAIALHEEALRPGPEIARIQNNFAWLLATNADPRLRDPDLAVRLATKAVAFGPPGSMPTGSYWHTLGVAQYRAGNWKESLAALEKTFELQQWATSWDWFFQAMAHWQLDEKDEARKSYDKAVEWMEKNKPDDDELRRFRAEAAELLGVKEKTGQASQPDGS